jgi:small conductance mechanosensitive channel
VRRSFYFGWVFAEIAAIVETAPEPGGDMQSVQTSVMSAWEQVTAFLTVYGLGAVGGIVILVVGWKAAMWASRAVDVGLARVNTTDLTLRRFIASVVRYVILTFTVLAVLSQFGVQTTSLIAVFGAAGLAIGLALQGTLANLAAGVMILVFRPFKIGDEVEAGGHKGTVESIDLFVTELRSPDNLQLLVPNGKIWGTAVVNFSVHATRRVDLKLVIDSSIDLDQAIGTVRERLTADERTLAKPAPVVMLSEVTEAGATVTAQAWTNSSTHGSLKMSLMRALQKSFGAALKTVSG